MKNISQERYADVLSRLQCLKAIAEAAYDYSNGNAETLERGIKEDLESFWECWTMGCQAVDEVADILKPE